MKNNSIRFHFSAQTLCCIKSLRSYGRMNVKKTKSQTELSVITRCCKVADLNVCKNSVLQTQTGITIPGAIFAIRRHCAHWLNWLCGTLLCLSHCNWDFRSKLNFEEITNSRRAVGTLSSHLNLLFRYFRRGTPISVNFLMYK